MFYYYFILLNFRNLLIWTVGYVQSVMFPHLIYHWSVSCFFLSPALTLICLVLSLSLPPSNATAGLCWNSTTPSPGWLVTLRRRTGAPACPSTLWCSTRCTTSSWTCCSAVQLRTAPHQAPTNTKKPGSISALLVVFFVFLTNTNKTDHQFEGRNTSSSFFVSKGAEGSGFGGSTREHAHRSKQLWTIFLMQRQLAQENAMRKRSARFYV